MVAFPHRDELEATCTDAQSPLDSPLSSIEGADRECGTPPSRSDVGALSISITSLFPSGERKVFSPENLRARLAVRVRLERRLSPYLPAGLVRSSGEIADPFHLVLHFRHVTFDEGSDAAPQGRRPVARRSGDYYMPIPYLQKMEIEARNNVSKYLTLWA